MKYFFHPSTRSEFNESIDYYEECQTGVGEEFVRKGVTPILFISPLRSARGGRVREKEKGTLVQQTQ